MASTVPIPSSDALIRLDEQPVSHFNLEAMRDGYVAQMAPSVVPLIHLLFNRAIAMSESFVKSVKEEKLAAYFNFTGHAKVGDELQNPEVVVTVENAPCLNLTFRIEGEDYQHGQVETGQREFKQCSLCRDRLTQAFSYLNLKLIKPLDAEADPALIITTTVETLGETYLYHLRLMAVPLKLKQEMEEQGLEQLDSFFRLSDRTVWNDARYTTQELVASMYGTLLSCHIQHSLYRMCNPINQREFVSYSDVQLAQQRAFRWCLMPMLYVHPRTGASELLGGDRAQKVLEFWGNKTFDRRVSVLSKARRTGMSWGVAVCAAAVAMNLQSLQMVIIVPSQVALVEMASSIRWFIHTHSPYKSFAVREDGPDARHFTVFQQAPDEPTASHIHLMTSGVAEREWRGPEDLRLAHVVIYDRSHRHETVFAVRHSLSQPPISLAEVYGIEQVAIDEAMENAELEARHQAEIAMKEAEDESMGALAALALTDTPSDINASPIEE